MWVCGVMLIYLTCSFVCGNKSVIMIDIDRMSWLDDQDFEEMIDYSFEGSRCCNIFADGKLFFFFFYNKVVKS